MVVDRPADEAQPLIAEFELALVSLGTPRFKEVFDASIDSAEPIKRAAYSVAYMDGVTLALVISGVVGIGGAVLAWILIGRRNPIETVFDMREERAATPTDTAEDPGETVDE
jgi:hypothetical protein